MLRLASLSLLAAALAGGCNTPSVPIPPPNPESISFEVDVGAGAATFAYDSNPDYGDAVVYVFNRDLGVGVIDTARADGSVGPTAPFAAELDNEIVITFELDESAASVCVRLQDGQSNSGLECNP